jgi:hypothetical protein
MKAIMCPSGDKAGEVAESGKWVSCTHALRDAMVVRRQGTRKKNARGNCEQRYERAAYRGRRPALLWVGLLAVSFVGGYRAHPRFWARYLHDLNRGDQTIPAPWQGLDEPWILGVIPECLAQFFHSSINAVFKIYEGIGGPELLLNLLPRHHFAGPLDERGKNLEGSFLELYLLAPVPHFTASEVNFEFFDPNAHGRSCWYLHGGARPAFRL